MVGHGHGEDVDEFLHVTGDGGQTEQEVDPLLIRPELAENTHHLIEPHRAEDGLVSGTA